MPEDANDVHVVGRTADGRVWHTIRSPGRLAPAPRDWTAFTDVLPVIFFGPPAQGHAVDVACARRIGVPGLEDGLWVLIAFDDRFPHLLFRSSSGQWRYVGNRVLPDLAGVRKVAIGTHHRRPQFDDPSKDYEVIHIALINQEWQEYLVFADADGGFPGGLVNPDEKYGYGPVKAIALDSLFVVGPDPPEGPSPAEASLLVVFDQGSQADSLGLMRYTLMVGPEDLDLVGPDNPDTVRFEPWELVLPSPSRAKSVLLPPEAGTFVADADLAMRSVAAVTGNQPFRPGVWPFPLPPPFGPGPPRTAYRPGMALLAPDQVPSIPAPEYLPAGTPYRWIDLEAFYLQLPYITLPLVPVDYGDFATISAAWTPEGRHFVGTTTDGRLLHQLRPPAAAFAAFGDVEAAVGQNVGTFIAVDCC